MTNVGARKKQNTLNVIMLVRANAFAIYEFTDTYQPLTLFINFL